MESHRRLVRDDIVRLLQQGMVPDLDDARWRFVPRKALIDIINIDQVTRLLYATIAGDEPQISLADIASQIVPDSQACLSCKSDDCTGGRSIFATLLLIGREEVILELFSGVPSICDQILPFRSATSNAIPSSISQPSFNPRLGTKDEQLFSHYQWQVISPPITTLSHVELSNHRHKKWDREVSLPWEELTRLGKFEPSPPSVVHKAKVFEGNHQLGRHSDNTFAVKTFKEWQQPATTKQRFTKELQGNIRAPSHERIVPLLSAIQHRESFILVFPWAPCNNLTEVWNKYSRSSSESLAKRFSERWLLDECLGIADAVATIHGLKGDPLPEFEAQVHADLKPENILCFEPQPSERGPITLKVADFGEASILESTMTTQGEVQGAKVKHTLSYRPPEHNTIDLMPLNYDVWCLGCLYLDFITWFLLGFTGVDTFGDDRMDEQDDTEVHEANGKLNEDVFFKKTRRASLFRRFRSLGVSFDSIKKLGASGRADTAYSISVTASVRTECKLKETVIDHMKFLETKPECSDTIVQFLQFIRAKMLVVEPKKRVQSDKVFKYLQNLLSTST